MGDIDTTAAAVWVNGMLRSRLETTVWATDKLSQIGVIDVPYLQRGSRGGPMARTGTNLLLMALLIAATFCADPSDYTWGFAEVTVVKYAPILLSLGAAVFYSLGAGRIPTRDPMLTALLSFGILALGGGLFTVIVENVPLAYSYVGRGLCVFTVLAGYQIGRLPAEKAKLGRRFVVPLFVLCAAMTAMLLLWRADFRVVSANQIFHEEAVWLTAAVGAALAERNARRRIALAGFFSLGALLTVKLTGFAFAAMALGALVFVEAARGSGQGKRANLFRRLWLWLTSMYAITFAVGVAFFMRAELPQGSTAVRIPAYTGRWHEFLDSPIVGKMFAGSPILEFGMLKIPSHSDLLDILAFGGITGAALFVVPVGTALWHGVASLPRYSQTASRLECASVVFAVAFLFELSFNPVIGQPKLVLFFWTAIGILLADRATHNRAGHVLKPHRNSGQG